MDAVTVAGIDCGTNSIRLMIASVDQDGLHLLCPRVARVVRLGEGVDRTRCFSQSALNRTYEAVSEFSEIIKQHDVSALRFVATSASRDVSNRAVFETQIEHILGVKPEVIPGSQEARLSFLGAISILESTNKNHGAHMGGPYAVVDLGGGSTELVVGGDGVSVPADQVIAEYSMNIGSVRMTERHLMDDPPTKTQIDQAIEDIDKHIDQAFERVSVGQVKQLIGVSGTVTTMSALALGLDNYDQTVVDGAQVAITAAQQANASVLSMNKSQRSKLQAIHPGRVDVIGGGALVWSRVLTKMQEAAPGLENSYIASEHGLLDGLVLDLGRQLLGHVS